MSTTITSRYGKTLTASKSFNPDHPIDVVFSQTDGKSVSGIFSREAAWKLIDELTWIAGERPKPKTPADHWAAIANNTEFHFSDNAKVIYRKLTATKFYDVRYGGTVRNIDGYLSSSFYAVPVNA